MADTIRYLCRARLQGRERIFLWETGDEGRDRVVTDERGAVVFFASEAEARQPGATGAAISGDTAALYDFDAIWSWCLSADATVDCPNLLNMWNLLTDIPRNADFFSAADSRADALYDKLFHGCHLPAMGACPDEYVPVWTAGEIADLKRMLLLGINDFRRRGGEA